MRFSGHENSAADTDYLFLSKLGVLLRNKTIAAPTQTRCAVSLFWLSAHRFFFPLSVSYSHSKHSQKCRQ